MKGFEIIRGAKYMKFRLDVVNQPSYSLYIIELFIDIYLPVNFCFQDQSLEVIYALNVMR